MGQFEMDLMNADGTELDDEVRPTSNSSIVDLHLRWAERTSEDVLLMSPILSQSQQTKQGQFCPALRIPISRDLY
jgi:hypothetical protein